MKQTKLNIQNLASSEKGFFSIWAFSAFAVIFLFGMIGLQLNRNTETLFKATELSNNTAAAGYQNLNSGDTDGQSTLNMEAALLQAYGLAGVKPTAGAQTDQTTGAVINLSISPIGSDSAVVASTSASIGLRSTSLAANLLGDVTNVSVVSASQASGSYTYAHITFDNSFSTFRPYSAEHSVNQFYDLAGLSRPASIYDEPPASLRPHMPFFLTEYSGIERPWNEDPQFNQFLTAYNPLICSGLPFAETASCSGVGGEISQVAKWEMWASDARREYLSSIITTIYGFAEYTSLLGVSAFSAAESAPIWDGKTTSSTASLNTGVMSLWEYNNVYQTPNLWDSGSPGYTQPTDGTFTSPNSIFSDAVPLSNKDEIAKYTTMQWAWEASKEKYGHILSPDSGIEDYAPGTFSVMYDPPRSPRDSQTYGMPYGIFPNLLYSMGVFLDWEEGPAYPSSEWVDGTIQAYWNRIIDYRRCNPLCSTATDPGTCSSYVASTYDCTALAATPVSLITLPGAAGVPPPDYNLFREPSYVSSPKSTIGYAGLDAGQLTFDAGSHTNAVIIGGVEVKIDTAPFAKATIADLINTLGVGGGGSRIDLAVANIKEKCTAARADALAARVTDTVACVGYIITDGQMNDPTLDYATLETNLQSALDDLTEMGITVFTSNIKFESDLVGWLSILNTLVGQYGGAALIASQLYAGDPAKAADLVTLWDSAFAYDPSNPASPKTPAEVTGICNGLASHVCSDSSIASVVSLYDDLYNRSSSQGSEVQTTLGLLNNPSKGRFLAQLNYENGATSSMDTLRKNTAAVIMATKGDPKVNAKSS